MEASTRRNQLGRRSILARIAAVLALAACGFAIYLLVTSFTEDSNGDGRNDKKGRSQKEKNAAAASYTVGAGDTLSGIALETGVPEPRIQRLNPELDAETLNAGQVLELR